jgi:hypothetical protein
MDVQGQLVQMRALLYQAPTAAAWSELLALFEGWSGRDGFDVALEYARGHLEGWPAHLRTAPRAWMDRLMEGKRAHPAWGLVRCLPLSSQRITAEDVWALARAPAMAEISHLFLHYNDLRDEAAMSLGRSEHLGALRWLDLGVNRIGDEGLRALCKGRSLGPLTHLRLGSNPIGDEGVEALCRSALPETLEQLTLTGASRVTARGVAALAARGAPRLRELSLSSARLGAEGLRALAGCEAMPSLEALDVSYTGPVEAALLYELVNPSGLPSLRKLTLRGCARVGEYERASLRDIFRSRHALAVLEL